MRVFVTGASGLIGTHLCRALAERGDRVVALSRSRRPQSAGLTWLAGDESTLSQWESGVRGCHAVVNLAGASIAKRWRNHRMREIVRSRVGITTALYHAIAHADERPRVMVSGSAVGYYGTDPAASFDETSPRGKGFVADLCHEWEAAASRCEALGVRVVHLRMGVVLAGNGGYLRAVARPIRAFVGGALGTGDQWVSWIHVNDLVRLILHAIDDPAASGALNAAAPEPVRQRDLVRAVGRALRRPVWLNAPAWALRLTLGRMAEEMLLSGQRVLPTRARAASFDFGYPEIQTAVVAATKK